MPLKHLMFRSLAMWEGRVTQRKPLCGRKNVLDKILQHLIRNSRDRNTGSLTALAPVFLTSLINWFLNGAFLRLLTGGLWLSCRLGRLTRARLLFSRLLGRLRCTRLRSGLQFSISYHSKINQKLGTIWVEVNCRFNMSQKECIPRIFEQVSSNGATKEGKQFHTPDISLCVTSRLPLAAFFKPVRMSEVLACVALGKGGEGKSQSSQMCCAAEKILVLTSAWPAAASLPSPSPPSEDRFAPSSQRLSMSDILCIIVTLLLAENRKQAIL